MTNPLVIGISLLGAGVLGLLAKMCAPEINLTIQCCPNLCKYDGEADDEDKDKNPDPDARTDSPPEVEPIHAVSEIIAGSTGNTIIINEPNCCPIMAEANQHKHNVTPRKKPKRKKRLIHIPQHKPSEIEMQSTNDEIILDETQLVMDSDSDGDSDMSIHMDDSNHTTIVMADNEV